MLGANAISTSSDGTGSAQLDSTDWVMGNALVSFLSGTSGPYDVSVAPQSGGFTVNLQTVSGGGHSLLFGALGVVAGVVGGYFVWGRK